MLYLIRVVGRVDAVMLYDFVDVTVTPDGNHTDLVCRVPDTAALSGVVVLLHDLGLRVSEMRSVPDVPAT
ncbi:hypothetical protein SAMN05216410_1450 [Sanguibacter gelidistatuariae]|uniref:ACT domain-containing protein n=1 Tax=Sanguibacter gelidistatuariae TaxID=1814289 RepID=A0A1G6JZQ4_9MICO|nr:hypothetical protein [Sanguibacter gelidistatuariae]SDC23865.1 hypothetical protein SAMN05216410_1450 [Sanguibacter gelidistatuariae]